LHHKEDASGGKLCLREPGSRPQRWRAAVAELVALQTEYAAWLDALPESLRDGATGEALQAIDGAGYVQAGLPDVIPLETC
jgi:hypothetical protein